MVLGTNIKISRKNKGELDKLKLTKSETYDEIISRLLELATDNNEGGFELYNALFSIKCEADFTEDAEHWYFLDDYGDRNEFLSPRESFVDDGVQKEYESFIDSINRVCQADLDLLDYGAILEINEVHSFDGFKMKRTY